LDTLSDIFREHSTNDRFLFLNQDLIEFAQEIPNPISALEIDLNVGSVYVSKNKRRSGFMMHFLEFIFFSKRAIFCQSAFWYPASVGDIQLNGNIKGSLICSSLATRNDFRQHVFLAVIFLETTLFQSVN